PALFPYTTLFRSGWRERSTPPPTRWFVGSGSARMSETTTQQQQPEQTNKQAAAIAAIAALLLISEDEESLSPRITTLLAGLGIASLAVRQAVRLAMIRPVTTIPATATGARATTRQAEFFYRATYIIQAARRFHDGSRAGRPMAQMMVDERRNYERHLDAQSRRAESARRIDVTARR